MRVVSMALGIALLSGPAAAQVFCGTLGANLGEFAAMTAITTDCRIGDRVAIDTAMPGLIARSCDLSKPTVTAGRHLICHVASFVGPTRSLPGSRGEPTRPVSPP